MAMLYVVGWASLPAVRYIVMFPYCQASTASLIILVTIILPEYASS
jgi:hypothetical protein